MNDRPSDPKTIDPREFRNALGTYATGVVVVTAHDSKGDAIGLTANSFSSVSLNPPLVLWSIDKQSETLPIFSTTKNFVISVLDGAAHELSNRFAKKGDHSVAGTPTRPTELGPPAIEGAHAVFECEVYARHEAGDHIILIGQVVGFTYVQDPERKGAPPLVYHRGKYAHLKHP